jgi:hypothetical protein
LRIKEQETRLTLLILDDDDDDDDDAYETFCDVICRNFRGNTPDIYRRLDNFEKDHLLLKALQ